MTNKSLLDKNSGRVKTKSAVKKCYQNTRRKNTTVSVKALECLETVAHHVIDCENQEFDNYTDYCWELNIKPENIRGKLQRKHIYAMALIGLNMVFPKD